MLTNAATGRAALSIWLALLGWLLIADTAAAVVTVRDTGKFVIDEAHVLEPAIRDKIENVLADLERETTDQIKLLTVKSLDGEDIFPFAQRHYESWKLGTKQKSNGALIVFALNDRKVRVHTGYGLEVPCPTNGSARSAGK